MGSVITVVGIGADGWDGLSVHSRDLVKAAEVLLGGPRHLAMLPVTDAVREAWPSPLARGLPALLDRYDGRTIVVVASGDPLVSGVGTTLVSLLGPDRVRVVPALSSVTLARARMNWSAESADVVTLVGRDADTIRRLLSPGRRIIVLSSDGDTPAVVGEILAEAGFGGSRLTVLSDLGAPGERRITWRASERPGAGVSALNVICVACFADEGAALLPTVPGLPDDIFEHDGQLTKRELRISALSRLAPTPGQLLWDVGAGAGSVAIEWMRVDPRCRAIAVEAAGERADRIRRNASRLGVPYLDVRHASAPGGLTGLPAPDAVFVGGGASRPGVLDACWSALAPGGRLVVHAVTMETEQAVVERYRLRGGELTRLSVERAEPLGTFTGWNPARPVVQWAVTKENAQ